MKYPKRLKYADQPTSFCGSNNFGLVFFQKLDEAKAILRSIGKEYLLNEETTPIERQARPIHNFGTVPFI